MQSKIIDCGELRVDKYFRLHVTKQCKNNGITYGDSVKVTIEKVNR